MLAVNQTNFRKPLSIKLHIENKKIRPPKDHIIWSLCCFVYSNPCCLGLAALIFSIKVYLLNVTAEENLKDCFMDRMYKLFRIFFFKESKSHVLYVICQSHSQQKCTVFAFASLAFGGKKQTCANPNTLLKGNQHSVTLEFLRTFLQPTLQTTVELTAMKPVDHPAEAVPLHGRYNELSVQPGGSTGAQYTTVNIPTEPPKDHIIWSLCCFVYSNPCCLGLAALIFSIKARDRKVAGDLDGARHYGSTARCLNIWATILGSIMILIPIIIFIIILNSVYTVHSSYIPY
ncbi:uncharacterized protein LOC122875221 [Siniperca chuatsi]|uniref:uncharacterized protein LOC122875221 n=1 Tax=Siniperca chuatsi TaxID=119488 RepID=UPI001CE10D0B|nr:uncharacterized protein LOC122875221 [Siniperca chuatsi]